VNYECICRYKNADRLAVHQLVNKEMSNVFTKGILKPQIKLSDNKCAHISY